MIKIYEETDIVEIIKNTKEKQIVLSATYWEQLYSHCNKGGDDTERFIHSSFNLICEAFEKSSLEEIVFIKDKEFDDEHVYGREPRIRFRKNSRGLTEIALLP